MPQQTIFERTSVNLVYLTAGPEETQALARKLAALLRPGDFLALVGELGGGKTCFVQGLAEALGVQGRVGSPTFVLLHYHPGPLPLCHVDAYRVGSGEELRDLGLEDYARLGVIALEWADRVPEVCPPDALTISFAYADPGRRLEFSARGERSTALLEEIGAT